MQEGRAGQDEYGKVLGDKEIGHNAIARIALCTLFWGSFGANLFVSNVGTVGTAHAFTLDRKSNTSRCRKKPARAEWEGGFNGV